MGNQNRNGLNLNSYNQTWRQHPNFSWSNQGNGPNTTSMPRRPTYPPGFSQQQIPMPQASPPSPLENMLNDYMTKIDAMIQSQATSMRNLEIQNKVPPKMKDPGSFTIPCNIGDSYCELALYDLGASIKLMPMSVFKWLGIGEVRPTTITLQLADRSLAHPDGKIKDVLVRVDKFIFPADFIILHYEAI
ncbi:uncharacterized protein LOC133796246 [Humulus lupulus]|uniref:uncharacterized protein LOC133796246 n=1 Tax=Humulus lupulus TaxID=3486 RepID=UPI002B405428|nr:uncharacterized protein LOC133796246 [Humulus lupulus]